MILTEYPPTSFWDSTGWEFTVAAASASKAIAHSWKHMTCRPGDRFWVRSEWGWLLHATVGAE